MQLELKVNPIINPSEVEITATPAWKPGQKHSGPAPPQRKQQSQEKTGRNLKFQGFSCVQPASSPSELVQVKEVPSGVCKPVSMDIHTTPHVLAWLKAQVCVVNWNVDYVPPRPREQLDHSSSPTYIQSITGSCSLACEATLGSLPFPLILPPPLVFS